MAWGYVHHQVRITDNIQNTIYDYFNLRKNQSLDTVNLKSLMKELILEIKSRFIRLLNQSILNIQIHFISSKHHSSIHLHHLSIRALIQETCKSSIRTVFCYSEIRSIDIWSVEERWWFYEGCVCVCVCDLYHQPAHPLRAWYDDRVQKSRSWRVRL